MTAAGIKFHKMHGLGNDFIVIDAVHQSVDLKTLPSTLMSDRHLGIGCDQILMIERGKKADFYCRIVNSDGSEAEQCGNGLRCVARYIHENGLYSNTEFTLETVAGVFPVKIFDYDHIRITIPVSQVHAEKLEVKLPDHDKTVSGASLSLGNPHFIVQVENIADSNYHVIGSALSTHPIFPQGTNVGFMEVVSPEYIRLRTMERGAGATLACGSNACAAVTAGILQGTLDPRVAVEFEHGQLTIEWEDKDQPLHMTGPASFVFSGVWYG